MDIRDFGTKIRSRFTRPQFSEFSLAIPEVTPHNTERRRSPRVEIETLFTAITKTGLKFSGYCRDISRDGTSAIIWGDLEIGQELCLAFRTMGDKEVVVIPAVVRSCVASRYGFEFTVSDSVQLESLIVKTCRALASYS
jgi:hypothetical protein